MLIQVRQSLSICCSVCGIGQRGERIQTVARELEIQRRLGCLIPGQRDLYMLLQASESVERIRWIRDLAGKGQEAGTQNQEQQTEAQGPGQGRAQTQRRKESAFSGRSLQAQFRRTAEHTPLQLRRKVRGHLNLRQGSQALSHRDQALKLRVLLVLPRERRETARKPSVLLPIQLNLFKPVVQTLLRRSHRISSLFFFCACDSSSRRCKLLSARNCNALTALVFLPMTRAVVARSYPRMSRATRTWRCSSVSRLIA